MPGALAMMTLLAFAAVAGCGDDAGEARDLAVVLPDLGAAPDLGCYEAPMTHLEILNACTNAQAIDKTPVTPRLAPDGTLPPLP